MIYLLPTQHDLQFGRNSKYTLLQRLVDSIIKEKRITLVCEEANQQDLDHPSNRACVKKVADCNKIPHLLCDLTDKERTSVGIFTAEGFSEFIQKHKDLMNVLARQGNAKQIKKKQDEFKANEQSYQRKREKAWFDRISSKKSETILFVLGAGHISSHPSSGGDGFDKLLEREGWSYKIVSNK